MTRLKTLASLKAGIEGDDHEDEELDERDATKITWDCAVRISSVWCMNSLIKTDRITPEHVVAEAFGRLQELVDKGTESQKLMKISSSDDGSSLLSRMKDKTAGRSSDEMRRSAAGQPRKLSRQTTTDFSGDGEQPTPDEENGKESSSGDSNSDGRFKRFRKKNKKNAVVTAQNPLMEMRADPNYADSMDSTQSADPTSDDEGTTSEPTSEDDGSSKASKKRQKKALKDFKKKGKKRGQEDGATKVSNPLLLRSIDSESDADMAESSSTPEKQKKQAKSARKKDKKSKKAQKTDATVLGGQNLRN
jgi:hypothetical protein